MTKAINTMTPAQEAAWLEEMTSTGPLLRTYEHLVTLMVPDTEYSVTEVWKHLAPPYSRVTVESMLATARRRGLVERRTLPDDDPRRHMQHSSIQYVYVRSLTTNKRAV